MDCFETETKCNSEITYCDPKLVNQDLFNVERYLVEARFTAVLRLVALGNQQKKQYAKAFVSG